MIKVLVYHKSQTLPLVRQIGEALKGLEDDFSIEDHPVSQEAPYLKDKEIQIGVIANEPNEFGLKEGLIFLRDKEPQFKNVHAPRELDHLGRAYQCIAEYSINRSTVIHDVKKLIRSFLG